MINERDAWSKIGNSARQPLIRLWIVRRGKGHIEKHFSNAAPIKFVERRRDLIALLRQIRIIQRLIRTYENHVARRVAVRNT